jgi:ubiquinone/menaquinone biosynthesis C-methylase UbiE
MDSRLVQVRDQQRDTWDRFSDGWKRWDAVVLPWLAPYGQAMISRAGLRDDSHVLDIASGTGEPGLTAAARVPDGSVTVTDLSERMLMIARENAARRGLTNVEAAVADAGALPFADASFDAVLCRFGFMFFPDIVATTAELVRVAKPGGRIVAAVWGDPAKNPWATTIMRTIGEHVDLPAPEPDSPSLFRCAPQGFMLAVFSAAGLRDVAEDEVESDLVQGDAEEYWGFMNDAAAPVVAGMAKADEPTRDVIRDAVLETVRRGSSSGEIRLRSNAKIIVGTR